ncbi:MAG TPA: YtxH domain-containing protein [Pyrinomonadaceae bacterium]|nr:YtxH domain-containing protein [Pyrinomonadaceae bacterium]
MKGIVGILGGVGAGAALMYLLDPDRGNRRRALIRDKAVSLNRRARKAFSGKVEDLGNRAKGLMLETQSVISRGVNEQHQAQ